MLSESTSSSRNWINSICIIAMLIELLRNAEAKMCYSCSGTCHNSANCNCQMGSCESNYCFIEKKPTEVNDMVRLTKGCVKRPSRTRPGCDFDHFSDHIQCVCQGDFCNDSVVLRLPQGRRNVTCRYCPDTRPDCSETCQGQWCHEMVNTGATGCGFGPPSLPYFYQTPELLYSGSGSKHRYCICNSHLCNDYNQNELSENREMNPFSTYINMLLGGPGRRPSAEDDASSALQLKSSYPPASLTRNEELYECVSCDLTTEQESITSACKQNRCMGQFCVYVMQRAVSSSGGHYGGVTSRVNTQPQAIIHERQGCINVTDKTYVQHGCSHKWMNNEEEELYCACKGNLCNSDITTVSGSTKSLPRRLTIMITCALLLPLLMFF